ncbi:MAG: hypothetical protein ACR2L2_12960, partial [Acidobacteriota bacterium]
LSVLSQKVIRKNSIQIEIENDQIAPQRTTVQHVEEKNKIVNRTVVIGDWGLISDCKCGTGLQPVRFS